MPTMEVVFWVVIVAGATLCGWWLSVRPVASYRDIASPVACLVLVLAVLLTMLAVTGQDVKGFTSTAYAFVFGP